MEARCGADSADGRRGRADCYSVRTLVCLAATAGDPQLRPGTPANHLDAAVEAAPGNLQCLVASPRTAGSISCVAPAPVYCFSDRRYICAADPRTLDHSAALRSPADGPWHGAGSHSPSAVSAFDRWRPGQERDEYGLLCA